MVRIAALLGLLAGCDGLFHLNEVTSSPADARIDAGVDTPSPDGMLTCYTEMFSMPGDLAVRWTLGADTGCHATVTNAALSLEADANVQGYAWGLSRDHASFVDNLASVRVAQVNGSGNEETLFELYIDDYNFYLIQYYQGRLYTEVRRDGTPMNELDVPYEAVSQQFWGFQYNPAGPTIDALTSPDGADWTFVNSLPLVVPIDDIKTQMLAGTFSTNPPTAQTALFDDYTRCTP